MFSMFKEESCYVSWLGMNFSAVYVHTQRWNLLYKNQTWLFLHYLVQLGLVEWSVNDSNIFKTSKYITFFKHLRLHSTYPNNMPGYVLLRIMKKILKKTVTWIIQLSSLFLANKSEHFKWMRILMVLSTFLDSKL